ncbi:unnamed protein product [Peronospora destructor]|uniref:Uncharacterized protein n=1 Tax=Peronospora destructor TaxID=86335 RepID=A0AAV0TZ26_9STRA|nr:unnamed protein product [Peronospora destructor]
MKSSMFAPLLACSIAIATAQNTTAGGQEGSMMTDTTTPSTTPAAPDMAASPAAPAPPSIATPVTETPGQVLAGNPSPMTDSDSGSFANVGDIKSPVTKRVMDSSRSESSSSVSSEISSAPMLVAAMGVWTVAGLLGFATML